MDLKTIIQIFNDVNIGMGILETLYMVILSTLISYVFGLPIGIISVVTEKGGILENNTINKVVGFVINLGRSIPFVILMAVLIPFTRFLLGTSIGTNAAIVSLTIAAIPFVSRVVEQSLKEVDHKLVEATLTLGASPLQIIKNVYLGESVPSLIRGVSITMITLVGYSAMAGVVGAGGLGNIAFMYGYQRFDNKVMILTVVILILIVQIIQFIFELIAKKIDRR